jgi:hypothetical protein
MLQRQFQEVGIENSDESGHLKEPIDSTLMALGVAYGDLESGTIADGDEHKAIAIARYQGLQAIADAAATWVDVTLDAPNTSLKRSQFVTNIEKALVRAKADAEPFMETVASSWGMGILTLDYIEPYDVEG